MKRLPKALRWMLAALTCILCISLAACAQADNATADATIPATETAIPATPTAAPTLQPTATPLPHITTGVLGGPNSAFGVSVYSVGCCTSNGWSITSALGDINIDVITDTTAEWDPSSTTQHIIGLGLTPAGNVTGPAPSWDVQTAAKACQPYLPPDAKFLRASTATNDIGTYPIRVYFSTLLAHSVAPAYFIDANGHAQPPGTFYEYLDPNGGVWGDYGGCRISIDEFYAVEGIQWSLDHPTSSP